MSNGATTPTTQPPKQTLQTRIGEFLRDVVTLDVLTLTGEISLSGVELDANKQNFSWDKLVENVAAGMKPDATNKLDVLAYTHAQWDLDSVNFVRKDLKPEQQALHDAHVATVAAAQKSRYEALKAIASLIT